MKNQKKKEKKKKIRHGNKTHTFYCYTHLAASHSNRLLKTEELGKFPFGNSISNSTEIH